MKRLYIAALAVCLCIAASACSYPVSFPRDDPNVKWGEPSASSDVSLPEPTGLVPLPTNEPVAVIESVTDMTLTLPFAFGERTGLYTGDMVNGLPEGNGTFTTENSDSVAWTYTGQWVNGHFNGNGTTEWADGFTEGGEYNNDYLNGEGWESWYGAIQYEGGYLDSEYNGQGTYYNQHNEIVYSGSFQNGLINESADDRTARVGAFMDQSVPLDIGDLYGSCQEEVSMRVVTEGEIFDVYYYPADTNPSFCDMLIYEGDVRDTEHIICVFYALSIGEKPPAEGETATIYGTTEYLYTYNTVDGDTLTVPLLEAWSVEMLD